MKITFIALALLLCAGIHSQNEVPQSVINSLNTIDDGKSLPEPKFVNKNTTLKIQVVGYNPEWNLDVIIEPNQHLLFGGDRIYGDIASDGTFEATFNLPIAQSIYIGIGGFPVNALLSPDKESKVYLDLDRYAQDQNAQYIFFSGENAEINNQMHSLEMNAINRKDYYDSESLKGKSLEEFKKYVIDITDMQITDLQKISSLSKKTLEFARARVELSSAFMMLSPYQYISAEEEQIIIDPSYYMFLKQLNLNDKKYAYHILYDALLFELYNKGSQVTKDKNNLLGALEQVKKFIGHEDGYAIDILGAKIIANFLTGIEPIEEEFLLEIMSSIKEPPYSEYLTKRNNDLKESFKTAGAPSDSIEVEHIDDISIDKLLEQNKGRIIFVDFWATWCGPCMADIRKSKSRKEIYIDEGVEFIYLTDESSPMKSWRNVKENISGKHYRLSLEKMKEILKAYNITFYPSYLIFNKKGELIFQTGEPTNILNLMDIVENELK